MAGRGFFDERPEIDFTRIKLLRNGRWKPFFNPVNPDGHRAGTNLAESFAEKYVKDFDVDVGLIGCAEGGTTIDQWREGGLLFDHACAMAELASRTSTIAGVLWHQGESDCPEHLYPVYEKKLEAVLDAFRKRLGLFDVPFILGGLGDYLGSQNPNPEYDNYVHINSALKNLAGRKDMMGFVSSQGLMPNPDNLHFSAQSLYELGHRYYDEFLKHRDENKVFEEKPDPDAAFRTNIEHL